ncbi:MAG: hypothetical protein IIX61_02080 [Loktanella sp.]|nr:hypothetical protein [Loktanella sp.]
MTKIDWAAKLTSRKFWLAICGLVGGIMTTLHYDDQTVTQITGIIMAGASVIAYIIGEGLIDAAGAKADTYLVDEEAHPPEDPLEDDLK